MTRHALTTVLDALSPLALGALALGALALHIPPPFGGGSKHQQWPAAPEMTIDPAKKYKATLTTSEGVIEFDLLTDQAPKTVNNFVFLARANFYDGVTFHRIIKGFMVQTGDPTGTGSGGPGYKFEDEKVRLRYSKGIVAMANAGPNTNGSQFFIVHSPDAGLPPSYTIFGRVSAGEDVLDKIAKTPVGGGGEGSKPQREVRIETATISEE